MTYFMNTVVPSSEAFFEAYSKKVLLYNFYDCGHQRETMAISRKNKKYLVMYTK